VQLEQYYIIHTSIINLSGIPTTYRGPNSKFLLLKKCPILLGISTTVINSGEEKVVGRCKILKSQDLAFADYFLFSELKFPLKGRHFQTVEEIQHAVTRELNSISKTAFLEGMKKLKEHANKYIDHEGMYFEE
jgi:hypothetical protein